MHACDAVAALRLQPGLVVQALKLIVAVPATDRGALPRVLELAGVETVRPGLVGRHATPAHDVGS